MKQGYCLLKTCFRLLTALCFCGVPPLFAQLSFNFDNCLLPPGTAVMGAAQISDDGTGVNCVLHLTDTNQCGANGVFVIPDPAAGANLDHLHVRWRSRVGGDLGNVCGATQFGRPGADGYSFNWGTDLAADGIGEEGTGTGLTVTVDTFDNGGGEAPALEIKWRGDRVACDRIFADQGLAKDFLRKNQFVEASLDVDANGLATFIYDGRALAATLPGWTGIAGGHFAFGARTGGASDNCWIDDLVIASNLSFPILMNEWLAQNVGNLADDFGERDPWLELYNAGDFPVELGGFFLTDDLNDKTKFVIPLNTILQPNGRLLVWADGQPGQSAAFKPHTNFRLSADGGFIALFSSGGKLIDSVTYGAQGPDLSQGRCPDGSATIHTMSAPTPGGANVSGDPVLLPLVITQPPLSQTVKAGTCVSFIIAAGGSPPLSYQWRRDGTNLPGATAVSLVLFNVQPADAGAYSVVVSDAFTSLSSGLAMLTVDATPVIIAQPQNQFVLPNDTVTFTVVADPPPLAYQWRRNGFRIPGATNMSYTISNVLPTDGGTYAVSVNGPGGKVLSNPAALVGGAPAGLGGDNFLSAAVFSSPLVSGNNVGATSQPGEPWHVGKPGGKSVWYAWQAGFNGIATIHTRGSTFDTLLGVYTGDNVTNLVRIAGDDDRGGFYTSEVRFNATAGTLYRIAVDGFAGAEGFYVLSREFEETSQTLPVITSQPANLGVVTGNNATFSVGATGSGLSYQWFFLGTEIPGATSRMLVVTNPQPERVGYYTVRVQNGEGRIVESLPGFLELQSIPGLKCSEKYEDLFLAVSGAAHPAFPVPQGSLTTGQMASGWVSTRGAGPGTQICSIPDNAMWHTVPVAAQNGIFCIEATGTSTKPRLVAAVDGAAVNGISGVPYPLAGACDATDATDVPPGQPGRVAFEAQAGVRYYYQVDTTGGDLVNVIIRLGVNLSIRPLPGSPRMVRLTWCATTNSYALEWTDRFPSPPQTNVWSAIPVTAISNGIRVDRFTHTADIQIDPLASSTRYFRLRKKP